jgi:hypothetical protein
MPKIFQFAKKRKINFYKPLNLFTYFKYEQSGMFFDSTPCRHFQLEETMKANVGGFDKIGRIAIGIALVGLAANGNIGAWGFLGVVPLLTGFSGYCPLYSIFKINTCPLKTQKIK